MTAKCGMTSSHTGPVIPQMWDDGARQVWDDDGPESAQSRPKSPLKSGQSGPKVGPKSVKSQPKVGPKSIKSRSKVGPKSTSRRQGADAAAGGGSTPWAKSKCCCRGGGDPPRPRSCCCCCCNCRVKPLVRFCKGPSCTWTQPSPDIFEQAALERPRPQSAVRICQSTSICAVAADMLVCLDNQSLSRTHLESC